MSLSDSNDYVFLVGLSIELIDKWLQNSILYMDYIVVSI